MTLWLFFHSEALIHSYHSLTRDCSSFQWLVLHSVIYGDSCGFITEPKCYNKVIFVTFSYRDLLFFSQHGDKLWYMYWFWMSESFVMIVIVELPHFADKDTSKLAANLNLPPIRGQRVLTWIVAETFCKQFFPFSVQPTICVGSTRTAVAANRNMMHQRRKQK